MKLNSVRIKKVFCYLLIFVLFIIIGACKGKKLASKTESEKETNVEVDTNERGVLFRRFKGGIDTSKVYLPGKYFVFPFDQFIVYNIQVKTEQDWMEALSKDGKKIQLTIQYSYRPMPEKVALLHYHIGQNYLEYVIEPEINLTINEFFENYTAIEIETKMREKFEHLMLDIAQKNIARKFIELESFQITELSIQ